MSRSKRELERQTGQPDATERTEPRQRSRYVAGRESERDFPRGAKRERDYGRESGQHYGVGGAGSTGYGGQGRFGGGAYGAERFAPRRPDYESRPSGDRGYYGERDYDEPRRENYGDYGQRWEQRGRTEREYERSRQRGEGREYFDYRGDQDREPTGWPQPDHGMLRCREIMTKDVTSCRPDSSLRDVADKMDDEDVGSIPVIDQGRLVGIVTDRDIVCRVLAEGRDSRTATAADAMSEDLVTCTPEETVRDAIHKMAEAQVRRLPVVDSGGRLRGMVSMADIALEAERDRELASALEQISRPSRNASRRR